jgi:hypothetical protein
MQSYRWFNLLLIFVAVTLAPTRLLGQKKDNAAFVWKKLVTRDIYYNAPKYPNTQQSSDSSLTGILVSLVLAGIRNA